MIVVSIARKNPVPFINFLKEQALEAKKLINPKLVELVENAHFDVAGEITITGFELPGKLEERKKPLNDLGHHGNKIIE